MVKGFRLSGFWTALFASLFISVLSVLMDAFVSAPGRAIRMPDGATWL